MSLQVNGKRIVSMYHGLNKVFEDPVTWQLISTNTNTVFCKRIDADHLELTGYVSSSYTYPTSGNSWNGFDSVKLPQTYQSSNWSIESVFDSSTFIDSVSRLPSTSSERDKSLTITYNGTTHSLDLSAPIWGGSGTALGVFDVKLKRI